MKVSVAFEILMLLMALTWPWPCTEPLYVNIKCSLDWLIVTIGKISSSSHNYIFSDELSLGSGCPVTKTHVHGYDFIYQPSQCGIMTMIISEDVCFSTKITFTPRDSHTDNHTIIPLYCVASRKSVWIKAVSTEDEIKLDLSPFTADLTIIPEDLGLLCP